MHTTDWPARRVMPEQCESAAGCTCIVTGVKACGAQQPAECGTELGADMPGRRAPLPNSAARWALVAFGGVVLILALIGAGALYAWAGAALMKDKPATTSTTKAIT